MRGMAVLVGSFRMGAGLVAPDFAGMSGHQTELSGRGLPRRRGQSEVKVSSAECGDLAAMGLLPMPL
ncbi:hypothetical protein KCMC57_up30530 [Kitasatospora sp. CMC57]|uniref:Transposase n=1 Tax=Kitasatospora sp. CMC57 TaxID=3231513 RepID=A0AB33JV16_9ACTN